MVLLLHGVHIHNIYISVIRYMIYRCLVRYVGIQFNIAMILIACIRIIELDIIHAYNNVDIIMVLIVLYLLVRYIIWPDCMVWMA